MIQDIGPKIFYNQYEEKEMEAQDYVIHFCEKMIYVNRKENEIRFATYGELVSAGYVNLKKSDFTYIFSIDGKKYFLLDYAERLEVEDYQYEKMYDVRRCVPKHRVMAAATAWHLHVWYDSNHFCGKCGVPVQKDHQERMLRCPACNNMIYPKIAPAVIVGVTDADKLLLTRYANREYKRYALIAGFTEIGESVEETVRREVMEEVGLCVKNIRYYKSQPWGFDSNLLLGFFCDLEDEHPIVMDEQELECAEWVRREDIPVYEEHLSLTHEMMQVFKEGL